MLFADGDGTYLAMAADQPFLGSSVGFVGVSDGWQQLSRRFWLADQFDRASDGNVALTADLALGRRRRFGVGAWLWPNVGRGGLPRARLAATPFGAILNDYASGWRSWQAGLRSLERRTRGHNLYRVSTAILHSHETPTFPGGVIASLFDSMGIEQGRR